METKIEISFNKISETMKTDLSLFGFKEYAYNEGVFFFIKRRIGFNFRQFRWTVKDFLTFKGKEEEVEHVIREYFRMIILAVN